jgi:hypothetical protein
MQAKKLGIALVKILVITSVVGATLFIAIKIVCSIARQSLYHEQRLSLSEAKEVWAKHNISAYQMRVKFWFQDLDLGREMWVCELEYQVVSQNVIQILDQQNCETGYDLVSIEEIFDFISEYYLTPSFCGNNGCVCDGPVETLIEYNQEYGYPELVLPVGLLLGERWRYTDIMIFSPPICHLLGTLSTGYQVTSFTPIIQ